MGAAVVLNPYVPLPWPIPSRVVPGLAKPEPGTPSRMNRGPSLRAVYWHPHGTDPPIEPGAGCRVEPDDGGMGLLSRLGEQRRGAGMGGVTWIR
jgi:hypothetical protein